MRTYQNKEKKKSASDSISRSSGNEGGQSLMPPQSWNGVKMPSLGGSAMPPAQRKKKEEEPAQKKSNGVAQRDRVEKSYDHDPKAEEALKKIAAQQTLYELAAHDVAYDLSIEGVDLEVLDALDAGGYQVSEPGDVQFYNGALGFRAVVIYPKEGSGKNPILAIRGTNPGKTREDFETIFTDLDQSAVGAQQFQLNQALIEDIIGKAGGKVDVTGHSLGGAMAQHVAVNYSGMVGNVATFQSPGIDQASVDKFNQIPEGERPNATHHIVTGDMVDKAGDANIAGDVYEHDFGKFLNVNQLLKDVKGHLDNVSMAATMLLDVDVLDPSQNVRDYELLKAVFGNMKAFFVKTGGDVGDAHATRAFSAENYKDIRAENGVSEDAFAEGQKSAGSKKGETAKLGKFSGHPHQDERLVAESIRSYLGPKLQVVFKLVWKALDTYESIKGGVSRGAKNIKRGWRNTRETISNYADEILKRLW